MPYQSTCRECGTLFPARPANVAVGKDQFCSRACYLASRVHVSATPIADRFWPRVVRGEDCWEWTGSRDVRGYGRISSGRVPATPLLAHRVSWELHNGPIPDDMGVLHRCDNPSCVRPDHLFLGDQRANVQDMDAKARRVNAPNPGERNGCAKLTEPQVREIRQRYAAGNTTCAGLGAHYGISPSTVDRIVRRVAWRHVS